MHPTARIISEALGGTSENLELNGATGEEIRPHGIRAISELGFRLN